MNIQDFLDLQYWSPCACEGLEYMIFIINMASGIRDRFSIFGNTYSAGIMHQLLSVLNSNKSIVNEHLNACLFLMICRIVVIHLTIIFVLRRS
jgi:hypothetical protein